MEFHLADLFELVVDTIPGRPALIAADRSLTFKELDERANRLAHHLTDSGIRSGDHVAIQAWNRAEWVETFMALFKIRAVPINVNYRYVGDELRYLLSNADVVGVILEPDFIPVLSDIQADLPGIRLVLEIGEPYERGLSGSIPGRGFGPRSPDDHYILYTGGTTGMPKGVMWRHEDVFFAAFGGGGYGEGPIAKPEELTRRIARDETRQLVLAPLMHGAAQWSAFNVSYGLLGGGTIVLNTMRGFDPAHVWRTVEEARVNLITLVGDAMARPLAEALVTPGTSYDVSSLFLIGSGGAVLASAVKHQLLSGLPNVILFDGYGASETGSGSVSSEEADARNQFTLNAETSVLDAELRPLSPGSEEVGRLARTGHIPLGYYKDDAKTGATFLRGRDGTRWVVPGDLAVVESDGKITLLGRNDACINTGGEKVFAEEVEGVLKEHPKVFDAVVVGVPDERFGEQVVAVVHARAGPRLTLDSVQAFCRSRLAGFKTPRRLVLVDTIPRTPTSKPDYPRARALATGT